MSRYSHFKKWSIAFLIAIIVLVYFHGYFACRKVDDAAGMVSISEILGVPLEQDDKRILKYIWENSLLEPPSVARYNLSNRKKHPSRGQEQFVEKMFGYMRGGFFVECGALDGETRSNSLWLERHLAWNGLLIEADPKNYARLKMKKRKAWTSNTCLATKPYPHRVQFMQDFNIGRILGAKERPISYGRRKPVVEVQCMPLFSLLSALNVTTVDYFSLDVEGFELQVLKTIPFNKIFIKTLSVEYHHTKEGSDILLEFMESNGYKRVGIVTYPNNQANDFMFAHRSIIDDLSIPS